MIKIYPASELLKLINEKIQLKYPMFNTYATSDEKLHCIKRARLLTTDGKESVSMVFSQAEVDITKKIYETQKDEGKPA